MKFKPNERIFRFLFTSPAWFVGETEKEFFNLTVAFPSFDSKGKELLFFDGPFGRSTFLLSVEMPPPPTEKAGSIVPMYEWIGEEASALLCGFYGKLVINLGHYQAGKFLTVPRTWDKICQSYRKPPFNRTPRQPDGPDLDLGLATEIIQNYCTDDRQENDLSLILRACEFYRMALENYDERPEMGFTLLISALESIIDMRLYAEEEMYDEKLQSDFAAIKAECKNGEKIVSGLKKRLYQVRRKVAVLVDDFLPDVFFSQRECSLPFAVVKDRHDLRKRVLAAYDIRSRILHTGERSGIGFVAHDHQTSEIGLGRPVMQDNKLADLLCASVNLTGLERITSTVLRCAIKRWLKKRSAAVPVTNS